MAYRYVRAMSLPKSAVGRLFISHKADTESRDCYNSVAGHFRAKDINVFDPYIEFKKGK